MTGQEPTKAELLTAYLVVNFLREWGGSLVTDYTHFSQVARLIAEHIVKKETP